MEQPLAAIQSTGEDAEAVTVTAGYFSSRAWELICLAVSAVMCGSEQLPYPCLNATLALQRVLKAKPGRKHKESGNNVPQFINQKGNAVGRTLDRLSRESPALFERVRKGELSANAAAIVF